jgi:hypothetical protein
MVCVPRLCVCVCRFLSFKLLHMPAAFMVSTMHLSQEQVTPARHTCSSVVPAPSHLLEDRCIAVPQGMQHVVCRLQLAR